MILTNQIFKEHLEKKYKTSFDVIPVDEDLCLLFNRIRSYINVDIYIKLLSFIDMWDYDNFQRFFFISLKHISNDSLFCNDIENIKDDTLLQLLCIICLQYYFS